MKRYKSLFEHLEDATFGAMPSSGLNPSKYWDNNDKPPSHSTTLDLDIYGAGIDTDNSRTPLTKRNFGTASPDIADAKEYLL